MLKILHLAYDDKFIEKAYKNFEAVYPDQNDVWIYSNKDSYKYIKSKEFKKITRGDLLKSDSFKELETYDCVILHTLIPPFIWAVLRASKKVKFIWCGWGYDYYDLIYDSPYEMYLPQTAALHKNYVQQKKLPIRVLRSIAKKIYSPLFNFFKKRAIKKLAAFCPVLPEEHCMTQKKHHISPMPQQIVWNYSNLEDDLIRNFEGLTVNGKNILIGNNATYTNNHLEVFEFLKTQNFQDREYIVPLSYGDDYYRDRMLEEAPKYLGEHFDPMMEFMPIDDYIAKIRSCDTVIMNHVRQQALGNIIIMLYLGAKVFIREECPTYPFLKNLGAVVFTVQELERDPSLIDQTLDDSDIELNRAALKSYWAKKVAQEKTRNLIETVINR